MDNEPLSSEDLLRKARESYTTSEEMTDEAEDDASDGTNVLDDSFVDFDDDESLEDALRDSMREADTHGDRFDALSTDSAEPIPHAPPAPDDRAERLGLNLPTSDPFGTQTSPRPPAPTPLPRPVKSASRFRFIWIAGLIVFGLGRAFFNSGVADVAELSPGDCLPELGAEEISDVKLIDCSDPHSLEVFSVVEVGVPGDPFPGENNISQVTFDACLQRFEGYVGTAYEDSELWIYTLSPVRSGWEDFDDRESICLLYASNDDGFSVLEEVGTFRNSQR